MQKLDMSDVNEFFLNTLVKPISSLDNREVYPFMDNLRKGVMISMYNHPQVPWVDYKIENGRVFVMSHFINLLESSFSDQFDDRLTLNTNAELFLSRKIDEILPKAYLSAYDAITYNHVFSDEYTIKLIEGKFVIRHYGFMAYLPGEYQRAEDAAEMILKLVQGHVIAGDGDFYYKGQAMTYEDKLTVIDLRNILHIPCTLPIDNSDEDYLFGIEYHPDIPCISKEEFNKIISVKTAWEHEERYAMGFVEDNLEYVISKAKTVLGIEEGASVNEAVIFKKLGKNTSHEERWGKIIAYQLFHHIPLKEAIDFCQFADAYSLETHLLAAKIKLSSEFLNKKDSDKLIISHHEEMYPILKQVA